MDVRIGVTQAKEIELDLGDGADADEVVRKIEESLGTETGMLWLTDRKGRRVGVPASKVAYVEVDSSHESRTVGFGAAIGR